MYPPTVQPWHCRNERVISRPTPCLTNANPAVEPTNPLPTRDSLSASNRLRYCHFHRWLCQLLQQLACPFMIGPPAKGLHAVTSCIGEFPMPHQLPD